MHLREKQQKSLDCLIKFWQVNLRDYENAAFNLLLVKVPCERGACAVGITQKARVYIRKDI